MVGADASGGDDDLGAQFEVADDRTLRSAHVVTVPLDGRPAGLGPLPPEDGELAPEALVVVAPAAALAELPRLYPLLVRALDLGRHQGLHGLYDVTGFAGRIALTEQPHLGALLSRRLLADLDPADAFHRRLALTALAFLDNGRRLDQTAAALFTHPHTVRYRLGRLRQITSASLTDGDGGPLAALHWWWALTAWLESPTQH